MKSTLVSTNLPPPSITSGPFPCLARYHGHGRTGDPSAGEIAMFFDARTAVVLHSVNDSYPVGHRYSSMSYPESWHRIDGPVTLTFQP